MTYIDLSTLDNDGLRVRVVYVVCIRVRWFLLFFLSYLFVNDCTASNIPWASYIEYNQYFKNGKKIEK